MNSCYILYSKSLNRYYIGATQSNISDRIKKHNDHSYGGHRYTAKANDWEVFIFIDCESYSQAIRIERHIKQMKSKTYIQNLLKFPEMAQKLKEKYKN